MAGHFPTGNVHDQILWLKRQLLCVKECCEENSEAITIINNTLIMIEEGMITYVTDLTDTEIEALSGVDIQTFYQSTDTSTMYYVNQAGDPTVFHPEDLDISYFERRATINHITEDIVATSGSYDDFRDTDLVAISRDYMNMPSMMQHNKNGKIYSYFRAGTNHSNFDDSYFLQRVSHDGGLTWTDIAGTAGTGNYDIVLDGSGVGGFDAPGGIITPSGRIILFIRYFDAGNTYIENRTYYSDDEGVTWNLAPDPWAAPTIGYVYGDTLVELPNGGIMIAYRDIQTDRFIRVAESYDDGLTWAVRSTMLDNSDKGWNFGETVLADYGGGRIVAISRLSALNDDSLNLPFICVSHDYGLTWAGDTETLSFQDIQDGLYGSGFLALEGPGVNLGGASATRSCLPYFRRADYLGKQYMVITYHIRELPDTGDLRLTVIDLDRWLTVGQDAIDGALPVAVVSPSPEGVVYDVEGNHSWVTGAKDNFDRIIGITSYADGLSSSGPQQIHYFTYLGVKDLIDTYEGITSPVADNLGDHIMTQNLQTSGFWISNDGDSEGIFVETDGSVGFGGQGSPTNPVHIGTGDLVIDQGNVELSDGEIDVTKITTAVADFNFVDLSLTITPSGNQAITDETIPINSLLTATGANTIGVLRNNYADTRISATGSVLGYIGNEAAFFVDADPSFTGTFVNMFSDMYFDSATAGFNTQDIDGLSSSMKFGAEGTVQDVSGLRVDIEHNVAGAFSGQRLSGIRVADVDAGLTAASWVDRYGILIEDTGNDAGVSGEDMAFKSENTKESQFAGIINYASDLSGSYTNRTLVDKEYVDGVGTNVPTIYNISGALTTPTTLADGGNALNFTGTGTRVHTSSAYNNTATGIFFNHSGSALGNTNGYRWGAGGFTGSLNAGFNIMNSDGVTENIYAIYNSGAISAHIFQTRRVADNYINNLQINTNFITFLSDDGTNTASMVVDAKTSPRVAATITDGVDTAQFFVKPVEALIESKDTVLATVVGGKLNLKTEYVADSNVGLAVGQVPILKDIATGEVEYGVPSGLVIGAEQSAGFTASVGTLYPVDVSGGIITVDPPAAPTAGDIFAIVDSRANSSSNNITVDFVTATQNYYAASGNATLSTDQMYLEFVYIDGTIGWIAKVN